MVNRDLIGKDGTWVKREVDRSQQDGERLMENENGTLVGDDDTISDTGGNDVTVLNQNGCCGGRVRDWIGITHLLTK